MPPRRIVPTAVVDVVPASPPNGGLAGSAAAGGAAGGAAGLKLRAPGAAGDGAMLRALARKSSAGDDDDARRVYVRLGATGGEDGKASGGDDDLPPGAVSAAGDEGYKVDWKKILAARGLNKKKKKKKRTGSGSGADEEQRDGGDPLAARLGGAGAAGVGSRRGGADIFSSVIERIERQYCFAGSSDDEEDEEGGEEDGEEDSSGSDDDDDDEEDVDGEKRGSADLDEKKGKKDEKKDEKKKANNRGYQGDHYEYDDGFLDDSELARFHRGGGGGDGSDGDGSDSDDGGPGARRRKYGGFYICEGEVEVVGGGGEQDGASAEDDGDEESADDDDDGGDDDERRRRGRGGSGSRKRSASAAEKPSTSLAAAAAAAGAAAGRASTPSSPRRATASAPRGASPAAKPPASPRASAPPDFDPPAGIARAVEELRAAVESLTQEEVDAATAGGQRKIPPRLGDLIARVACQSDDDFERLDSVRRGLGSRAGKHWLSATVHGFMSQFTTRGNLTARLRTDGDRARVNLRVSEGRLRDLDRLSLDGSSWPPEADAACDAFLRHWLVVNGGTREGEGGKAAAARAARDLLGLGGTPAATDAVLASAGRGALAREREERDRRDREEGVRASADGGGAGAKRSSRSPTPSKGGKRQKKEPTPPPPCPVTERIVASAVEAGASRDVIERSFKHFAPGRAGLEGAATIKAVVNKALLHLGRRGGGVSDVVRAAIELGITGDPPWKEDNKSRKSHISSLLSSGGIPGGSGGGGPKASSEGGEGDAAKATPFFVQVAQRGNGFVYAHAAYPGLVFSSSRPSSSSAAAKEDAASKKKAKDDGEFEAEIASVAAALGDTSLPLPEKLKVVSSARVEVIEELTRRQPVLKPVLEAVSKAKGGGGGGGKGGKKK